MNLLSYSVESLCKNTKRVCLKLYGFLKHYFLYVYYRYAFIESSQSSGKSTLAHSGPDLPNPNGLLHSPQLGSTGVLGTCFMFKYAIDGLSAAGLRVLLHPGYDEFSSTATKSNETKPGLVSCDRPFQSTSTGQIQQEEHVLWNAHYHILGVWQQAQILYTFPDVHTVSSLVID